ncbi:MAG TPA: hypothetical protein VHF26_07465 [Trebonia sp.]|nr:hypothetical protein [Trebonia sp.]
MSVFLVIRPTRGDEEAGRLEPIGSARVGRQAPLASAIAVAAVANVVLTALLCLVLPLLGLPAAGSAALALAIGICGLAFTAISVVAAQLTTSARAARGLAIGVLGAAFLASLMLLAGLIAAGYGVSAVLRLHAEEAAGNVSPFTRIPKLPGASVAAAPLIWLSVLALALCAAGLAALRRDIRLAAVTPG